MLLIFLIVFLILAHHEFSLIVIFRYFLHSPAHHPGESRQTDPDESYAVPRRAEEEEEEGGRIWAGDSGDSGDSGDCSMQLVPSS